MLSDTSPSARDVYFRRLAEMTPSERVTLGVALWEAGDATQRAALHRQYPEAGEADITYRIAVTRFGPDLARRAYQK